VRATGPSQRVPPKGALAHTSTNESRVRHRCQAPALLAASSCALQANSPLTGMSDDDDSGPRPAFYVNGELDPATGTPH